MIRSPLREACVYGGSDLVAVFPEHLCCCTRIIASTRTLYSGEQEWLPCLEHIVIHRFKEKMLWVKKRSFHICNTQRPQTATAGYKMYCSKMICNFWTTHPFHMLQQVEWSGVSQCVKTFRRSIVNMFCCTIPKKETQVVSSSGPMSQKVKKVCFAWDNLHSCPLPVNQIQDKLISKLENLG